MTFYMQIGSFVDRITHLATSPKVLRDAFFKIWIHSKQRISSAEWHHISQALEIEGNLNLCRSFNPSHEIWIGCYRSISIEGVHLGKTENSREKKKKRAVKCSTVKKLLLTRWSSIAWTIEKVKQKKANYGSWDNMTGSTFRHKHEARQKRQFNFRDNRICDHFHSILGFAKMMNWLPEAGEPCHEIKGDRSKHREAWRLGRGMIDKSCGKFLCLFIQSFPSLYVCGGLLEQITLPNAILYTFKVFPNNTPVNRHPPKKLLQME